MSGDKLKRVKAVKRWLDKAEHAYSGHQELSGEMNLMMAQAEMQRLKEVHKNSPIQKWGLRGCAMIVAVLLFFGFHFMQTEMNKNEIENQPSVEIVIQETPAPVASAAAAEKEEMPKAVEAAQEAQPAAASVAETVTPILPAVPVAAAEPIRPAPPALSDQEIQSVVGEAGRALRGQV